ncbi:MAG: type 4a pilus biogenesis protein PilO [bacterium]|nr:type 4a pilus biogenesis protein PilO [bacterium]
MAIDYKSSLSRYRTYLNSLQQQPLWQASLIIVFSLGLLIILLSFVLRPTLITISTLLGQIEVERQVEQRLDAKITSLQQATQLLNSIESRLVYLDESLPTSAKLSLWAQAVEALATGSGVFLTDITMANIPLTQLATSAAVLSNPTNIDFSISSTASYSQLADFVQALENLPRLAILNSVQLGRQNTGELTMQVKGIISFTYAQKNN